MKGKGICQACSRDEQCTYIRIYPVNNCDEYLDCYFLPKEGECPAEHDQNYNYSQ